MRRNSSNVYSHMIYALERLFLIGAPGTILISTAIYFAVSYLLGCICLRRPLFEGLAIGFLIFTAGSNLSFYFCKQQTVPLSYFPSFSIFIIVFVLLFLWRLLYRSADRFVSITFYELSSLVIIWPIVWVVNIINPEPSAGYSAFQAWYPLYLMASNNFGLFLSPTDMTFGVGVLTNTLHYAIDILGPAAFLTQFGIDENGAVYGAHITAVLLMFGVLVSAIGPRFFGQATFVLLTVIFFRFGSSYRTVLGDNWGDNLLFLPGALICYYLVFSRSFVQFIPLAVMASAFMVFARHFGAYYFAFIGICGFFLSYYLKKSINWAKWLGIVALGSTFALKELIQVWRYGPYYPRDHLADQIGMTVSARFLAISRDLGFVSESVILALPIPSLFFAGLAFLVVHTTKIWRNHQSPWSIQTLAPIFVVAAPVTLELITGYRSPGVGSKPYICMIFFLSWYPAFLMSHMPDSAVMCSSNKNDRFAIFGLGTFVMVILTVFGSVWLSQRPLGKMGLENYINFAFESYRHNNFDRGIVKKLEKQGPDFVREVRSRPLLYFHYEPGIGLRWFLGGDITKDWDYWSVPVQEHIRESVSFEDFMEKLGWPNISIGYPSVTSSAGTWGDPTALKFKADIEGLSEKDWVSKTINYRKSILYITDEPR